MTQAASILLLVTTDLRRLPEADQDVLRRFFTQCVRGADDKHHKRWIRLVRDWWNCRPGTGFQLYRAEERSGTFHRLHRGMVTALFERQELYTDKDVLHDWLKLQCWFVDWVEGQPVPKSTNYDSCSEDEIREFNAKLQHLLHQAHVQRHFWPHLTDAQRSEAVDGVLTPPERNQ